MADKKPLRISDDTNDLQPVEFAAADSVGIVDGGTSATTANGALNNLLPSQAGNNGKVLGTNGSNTSWVDSSTNGAGVGGVRVNFWSDGSTYNKWLRRDNNHSEPSGPNSESKSEPWVFVFAGEIRALSFVNKKIDSDTDIQIFKNGTLQFTWNILNKKWATKTNLTPIVFAAGDKLSVFAKEIGGGDKPEDVLLDVYIAFTNSVAQELGGGTL